MGSLVAQTPEHMGGGNGLLAYIYIYILSGHREGLGQHSGITVKCKMCQKTFAAIKQKLEVHGVRPNKQQYVYL